MQTVKSKNVSQVDTALQLWLRSLNGNTKVRPMQDDLPETHAIKEPLDKLHKSRFSKTSEATDSASVDTIMAELASAIDVARSSYLKRQKCKEAELSNLYPT